MLNSVSILLLSAHLMQVQLLLVTFNLNGGLHAISIEKPSENHPYLETVSTDVKFLDDSVFFKPNPNQILVFCTSLLGMCIKLVVLLRIDAVIVIITVIAQWVVSCIANDTLVCFRQIGDGRSQWQREARVARRM